MGEVLFRRTFQFPPSLLSHVPIWSVPLSAHHNLFPTHKIGHSVIPHLRFNNAERGALDIRSWISRIRVEKQVDGALSPMMARAVALVSFPFTPSMISSPEPSSLQRLMVLFPELIQYNCCMSKSMDRPVTGRSQRVKHHLQLAFFWL